MTRARLFALGACLAAMTGWPIAAHLQAADHGQMGDTFPIIETDLLTTIEAKLRALEASGGIAALQRQMQNQAVASVRRPKPVEGLSAATVRREWLFDPSVVTEDDIHDTNGNLIAARGTKVNPLGLVQLRQDLVFVDGNNAAEVDWALRSWSDLKAKIVFVSGSPFDEMKPRQRRLYFDQGGMLVARFGIRHTPAVVSQSGDALKVAEIPLVRAAPGPRGGPAT
ncbi:type-F conjugative transfer system protein TraW [Sphingobium xenophagum]|uniref:type-F conjugative transfer system protein TraW n=1 Tax=Sphingobium xenophagum TaxID=121428 RepID=UPI0003A58D68|nr:type-F conjugative transfer system protein TraW [Sphingobium xenophagum]